MAISKSVSTCVCYAGIAALSLGCSMGKGSSHHAWWTSSVSGAPSQARLKQPVKTNIRVADMEAKNGFDADARKHYQAALKHDPKAVDAIVGIARLDEKMRRTSQAERGYRKALDYDANSVAAVLGLARLDQLAGRNVRAEQGFKKAINLQPDNAEAHASLGMFYGGVNRWDEAVTSLKRAVAANPKSSTYRFNLAKAIVQTGDLQAAMPHFAVTVGEAAGHYNIGYILHEQGRLEAAERQYRMALSINPELQEARQLLSELQRDGVNTASAERTGRRGDSRTGAIRPLAHRRVENAKPERTRFAGYDAERREPIQTPQTAGRIQRYDSVQRPTSGPGRGDTKTLNWSSSKPVGSQPVSKSMPYDEVPISSPVALRRTVTEEPAAEQPENVGVNPFAKPGDKNVGVDMDAMTPAQREQWANQK